MFLGLNRNIALFIAFALIPIAIIYQLIKPRYEYKQDNNYNLMSEINKLDMIIRENITVEKIQSKLNQTRKDIIKEVKTMIDDSVFILEHKRAIFFRAFIW